VVLRFTTRTYKATLPQSLGPSGFILRFTTRTSGPSRFILINHKYGKLVDTLRSHDKKVNNINLKVFGNEVFGFVFFRTSIDVQYFVSAFGIATVLLNIHV
jgi:hypothetical protein